MHCRGKCRDDLHGETGPVPFLPCADAPPGRLGGSVPRLPALPPCASSCLGRGVRHEGVSGPVSGGPSSLACGVGRRGVLVWAWDNLAPGDAVVKLPPNPYIIEGIFLRTNADTGRPEGPPRPLRPPSAAAGTCSLPPPGAGRFFLLRHCVPVV